MIFQLQVVVGNRALGETVSAFPAWQAGCLQSVLNRVNTYNHHQTPAMTRGYVTVAYNGKLKDVQFFSV